jgi:hypothetical protein
MPKNNEGKNKKWSKHVDKNHGEDRLQELEEKAARLGVEVWELEKGGNSSSEEEEKEEIKEMPKEDSGSDSDTAVKGHAGLIEIENPNRLKPLRKSDFRTEEEMADSKKALKFKAQSSVGDLQRLQEVRARREAAAKQREEMKAQATSLKEEAKKKLKKKPN